MEAIIAERSLIVAVLVASGVPQRDRADVEQGIIIGAWRSIERGMYRPAPEYEPRKALRRWLWGIAWRKTGHYLGSAYVRRTVLNAQPFGMLREPAGLNLEAQLQARETLDALADLPDWQLEALLIVDAPESLVAWEGARDEPGHRRVEAQHRPGGCLPSASEVAPVSFNIRDPKHRMAVAFPGRPVIRRVSPGDVERYLRARGYEPHRLDHPDRPPDAIYSRWPPRPPPRWPDPRPTIDVPPRPVRGLRECCKSLEQAIETIAHNEGRATGEVLREIAAMARMAEDGGGWAELARSQRAMASRTG